MERTGAVSCVCVKETERERAINFNLMFSMFLYKHSQINEIVFKAEPNRGKWNVSRLETETEFLPRLESDGKKNKKTKLYYIADINKLKMNKIRANSKTACNNQFFLLYLFQTIFLKPNRILSDFFFHHIDNFQLPILR